MTVMKTAYYSNLITNNKHNSKILFNTFSKLTQHTQTVCNTNLPAHDFLMFFNDKVDDIRNKITESSNDKETGLIANSIHNCPGLHDFKLVSLDALTKIVMSARSTTCSLDPLPSWAVKELWSTLGPYILQILHLSLSSGVFPDCFKIAVVKPLLKKPGLDVDSLTNYRPVSNLAFLSKIFEKVVSNQLIQYLSSNNLFESLQSAFRSNHSTETAIIKVVNDLLLSLDSASPSILLLLDLSSAFDTLDHHILLDRLEHFFGISGQVLLWLKSYLLDRSQSVVFNNTRSESCAVRYGVPQGSVLGPLLFSLYLAPLGQILRSFKIVFHCYADDLQLYMPLTVGDGSSKRNLIDCLAAVKSWLSANFLLLNSAKTEMLLISPTKLSHLQDTFTLSLDDCVIHSRDRVKNLGVVFDYTLSFNLHIKEITRVAFFHLRNIARIRSALSFADTEVLIHAFVTSRLDYCNALLSGLPKKSIHGLQMVQNAAARILTGAGRFDHVTSVLASLHWLPVQVRADFKVLLLTYKIVNGTAPLYLSDLVKPYVPARSLRSQDSGLLCVPKVRKKTVGERAFSFRAPTMWNRLPMDIRQSVSLFSGHF